MRLLPWLKIPLLLASVTAMYWVQPEALVATTLPSLTSFALDKSKVTLPDDLASAHNVMVFYFEPDQSEAALAWVKGVEQLRTTHPDLQSYLLPVYSRENFLYRWWITASTRIETPAEQNRHTTIPIFVDKENFLPLLGITSEKQPFVVLADKTGHIQWKTEGSFEQWRADQLAAEMGSDVQAAKAISTGGH